MDYERGSDADLDRESSTSQTQVDAKDTEPSDLGTDADVMNDVFESGQSAPPEWPAADLAGAGVGTEDVAGEPDDVGDLGDDSDAPIEIDERAPVGQMMSNVRGETVNLSQGGVQSIQAATVTVSQGGAGQVRAESISVEQGGLGLARANTLTLRSGASAFAVVADQATVEEGSSTFLIVSRSFAGDVQPAIDWRVAMAFGAGLGLVLSIFRRLR